MKEQFVPIEIPMMTPEQLSEVDVVVFDMDGTIYELDGGGFFGSDLHQAIVARTLSYIVETDGRSVEEAAMVISEISKAGGRFSEEFAKRYDITPKQYFDHIWDVDPEGIVHNFETSVAFARGLKEAGKTLILLTGAPDVWRKRVFDYLGISDVFDRTYAAEDYRRKEDVFEVLAREFTAEKVLSIGDQIYTDILPAHKHGLKVLHVKSPTEFAPFLAKVT